MLTSAEFERWPQYDVARISKQAEELYRDNPELKGYGIDLDDVSRGLMFVFCDWMSCVTYSAGEVGPGDL